MPTIAVFSSRRQVNTFINDKLEVLTKEFTVETPVQYIYMLKTSKNVR